MQRFKSISIQSNIETINPLEQGLKPSRHKIHRIIENIETINPLEQGLKQEQVAKIILEAYTIETINPLEQGLKLYITPFFYFCRKN